MQPRGPAASAATEGRSMPKARGRARGPDAARSLSAGRPDPGPKIRPPVPVAPRWHPGSFRFPLGEGELPVAPRSGTKVIRAWPKLGLPGGPMAAEQEANLLLKRTGFVQSPAKSHAIGV